MADPLADAGGHKPVVLSDLKTWREAPGKVLGGPPEKHEGLGEEGGAEAQLLEAEK